MTDGVSAIEMREKKRGQNQNPNKKVQRPTCGH